MVPLTHICKHVANTPSVDPSSTSKYFHAFFCDALFPAVRQIYTVFLILTESLLLLLASIGSFIFCQAVFTFQTGSAAVAGSTTYPSSAAARAGSSRASAPSERLETDWEGVVRTDCVLEKGKGRTLLVGHTVGHLYLE